MTAAHVLTATSYDPDDVVGQHQALTALIAHGLDELPLPGQGRTLQRWQTLAAVAAHDVTLIKLVEGHADALAIIAELGASSPPPGTTWGTWASEGPGSQVDAYPGENNTVLLSGRKGWCSGAPVLSHGLLTCTGPAGQKWLAAVDLSDPRVHIADGGWDAIGMSGTNTVPVSFNEAPAQLVGQDGDYLSRRGFWAGGAGIAACWWGAAHGIARALYDKASSTSPLDPHALAHLGALDTLLSAGAAHLREAARLVDSHDQAQDLQRVALQARAFSEHLAEEAIQRVGRALGPAPLCQDRAHAKRVADLTVFIRQSHAERDLQSLATTIDRAPIL